MSRMTDSERAKLLGMSVDELKALVGDEKLLDEEKEGCEDHSQPIDSTRPFNPAAPDADVEPATSTAPAPLVSRAEKLEAVYKKVGKNFKNKEAFIKWIKEAKKHPKKGSAKLIESTQGYTLAIKDINNFSRASLATKEIADGVSVTVARKDNSLQTVQYTFAREKFNSESAIAWISANLTKKAVAHIDYVEDLYEELGVGNVIYLRRQYTDQPLHIKPKQNYWDKVPDSAEEKALYMGFHVHSADNPFGLHTHVPGGKLTGAHVHGPQNRSGMHTHAEFDTALLGVNVKIGMIQLDGNHVHLHNHIDGGHMHCPEAFG